MSEFSGQGWEEDRQPTEEEIEHAKMHHPSWVHPLDDEGPHQAPPGAVIAIPFGPSRDQMERMELEASEWKHSAYGLFDTLNEEQLMGLVRLLNMCGDGEGSGPKYANHFEGIVMGMLSTKFGHCLACGKNHDKEAAEMTCDG